MALVSDPRTSVGERAVLGGERACALPHVLLPLARVHALVAIGERALARLLILVPLAIVSA